MSDLSDMPWNAPLDEGESREPRISLLRQRDPEIMLRNAHRLLCREPKFHSTPLWYLVSEITSYGSTYSNQLCRELGWNPNALTNEPLPARATFPTPAEDR